MSETSNHNGNPPLLNSLKTDNNINSKLKETLKANFLENIERFETMPLKERSYHTKITTELSENEIQMTDDIVNEYATNLKNNKVMLDHSDINAMLYTAAITYELIIKCKQLNTFTTHQLKISTKLKQLFGNTKIRTLEYNLKILKQDLKALSKKLSYQSN